MNNRELNLRAMQEFFQGEITLNDFLDELDTLYSNFTDVCMKLSNLENMPIEPELIRNGYYIRQLKGVLKTIQNENESRTE